MIHAFLLALLPSPVAALPQAPHVVGVETADTDSVLEVYDLRPLMPRFDGEAEWMRTMVFPPANRFVEDESTPFHNMYDEAGSDVIIDLLIQVLGGELQYEGREIAMDGPSRLLVLAPAAIQARVEATLGTLETVLSSSAEITVDVVELPGDSTELWPKQNVVPAAEVDRSIASALGRGGVHQRFHMQLSAGRTAWLDQMRHIPILFDYDVEIASGSFIQDPIIVELEEGIRLLLRGAPTEGGLVLSALFQTADVLEIRDRPVDYGGRLAREKDGAYEVVEGPKRLQTADVLHRSVAFDAFLPDGQALVFATRIDLAGQESTQLVFLRKTGGSLLPYYSKKLPGSSQTLILVNSETLSLPTMGVEQVFPSMPDQDPHPAATAVLYAEPSLFLFDWMKFRFSVWRRLGPWAVVITDPAWDKDAAQELAVLMEKWHPPVETVGLDVKLSARGGTERVPIRCSVPARPGSDCGIVAGITGAALYDFDVEVAQFSCVADAVHMPVFNGLCLAVTPSAIDGGYSLDVQGTGRLVRGGQMPTFDPQSDVLGSLDQPAYDQLLMDARRAVGAPGAGSVAILGGEGKDGDYPVLRLEIGVR